MTDDEAAFVRGMAAGGDDLTPRLVFADWLDDRGDHARAAFVRDSVFVATTPADTPDRRAAAARAFAALRTHGRRWAGPLARHAHDWLFRGGFPDLVGLAAAKLRRNAATLFAHAPVRSLLVTDLAGRLDTLAAVPPDNGVTRLSLWGGRLTPARLPELAASLARFPRLHTLSLLFNSLDSTAVPLLLADPFRGLTLELGANPLTDAARDDLRAALGDRVSFACEREPDWVYRIEDDDPFYNGVTPDGVQVVTRDGDGIEVARFDLAGNVLGVETVAYDAGDPDKSLLEEMGARPADVAVKRFTHADGRGIRGVPGLAGVFEGRGGLCDLDTAHEVLAEWLGNGEFAFGNCLLDRKGHVFAT